jgi:ribosomal protein S20
VGELVIFDARLSELARQPKDPNLVALAEQITRLSLGLRDTAMSIRMVPFGTLASRFERLVADLSMNLGKDVDMIVSGCDTELDKTMIEKLADPLVHIVRNSMDHGIEKAEDRAAAGKPASGSIEIKAEHIGSEVIVTVKDDGKGLDADRIHAKAVEKGILAADEQVSQNRLFSLIFEPAFSTQTQVSALSGRGVGMDVVKKTIDSLRGRVEVAGEKYTIPVSVVNEIVDLPPANYVGNTASDFLNVLVPEIEQTSILVSQISVSMRELAMGTDQITTAVRQLDQVTQENTAASEELSSSAVELSSQAENLKDAISFFELPRARGILRRTKAARKKSRTSQSGYAYNLGHSSPKKPAKKPERQPKSFDFDLDSDVTDEDDAQFERYAAE